MSSKHELFESYPQRVRSLTQSNMVTRISKLFVCAFLSCLVISCDSSSTEMTELFGIKNSFFFGEVYREEQWGGPSFGDGYKVVVYYIPQKVANRLPLLLEKKGFTEITTPVLVSQSVPCQLLYEIQEGSVLSKEGEGERTTILWDSQKERIIYVLAVF